MTNIYDIEAYPNHVLVIFLDIQTGELHKLKSHQRKKTEPNYGIFSEKILLIGYNNHRYDDKILMFLAHFDYEYTPYDIYCYSRYLIDRITIKGFAAKLADLTKIFATKNLSALI
jgi:hypothetical protein